MNSNADHDPSSRPIVPSLYAAGLWSAYYFTLFIHLSLLAALVTIPGRSIESGFLLLSLWMGAFAIVAAIGRVVRVLIHDTLVGFTLRERLGIVFFVAGAGIIPFFIPGSSPMREALLWMTPPMLLLAVTPSLARRLLAITLAAGWIAAIWVREPLDFCLLLLFAGSWFFALGMTRLAFTADEYGVWGGRPIRRLATSTIGLMIPATVAGGLAFLLWPAGPGFNIGSPSPPIHSQLPRLDLQELLKQSLIFFVLLTLIVILMVLFRRWLLRRKKGILDFELLPGQAAELEYRRMTIETPRHAPAGLRGAIVRLWGRWETAMAGEELGRQMGETADEFAARLAKDSPDAKPPAEVTRLFDQAHYGTGEPTERDVARMRGLVEEELSRQSLRLQAPMEPKNLE